MSKLFAEMGARIERRWRGHDYDERAFPSIAAEALVETPPARQVAYADLVEELLFDPQMPPQPAELSFGQPPITVFSHPRFYIEVLCWMDATTSIHQHAFSGAFHVLAGSSVHSRYEFALRERINLHFLLGDLRVAGCELLRAGDTRPIAAGREFIHALFHLDRPSISVVVRTRGEADAGPQYDYLPPHVALDGFEKNPIDAQREQLLRMLLASDREQFDRIVDRSLAQAELPAVFRVLRFVHERVVSRPYELDAEYLQRRADRARERFGGRVDLLLDSASASTRVHDLALRRADVTHPDHRFFLALLLNLPDRARIQRLIAQRYPGEPSALVRRWLRELTRPGPGGGLSLLDVELEGTEGEEEGSRAAAASLDRLLHETIRLMLAGARDARLVAGLREALPGVVDDIGDGILALQQQLAGGALRPLFVEG
jgi:hypothetical protein